MLEALDANGVLQFPGIDADGNLRVSASAARLQGDLSADPPSSRLMVQTSTPDMWSSLAVIPNGAGSGAYVQVYPTSNADNASYGELFHNGSVVGLYARLNGTAAAVPLTLGVGGTERLRIGTDGHITSYMTGPAIGNNAFVDGNLELYSATPGAPRIGFHESGHSGLALYKPAGDPSTLRVRTNGGTDYALARSPTVEWWQSTADGAAHDAYPAAWTAYDVPGMPIISFTLREAAWVRFDWYCQFSTVGPSTTYFGVNIDGLDAGSIPATTQVNNLVFTAHGYTYSSLAAGAHTAKLRYTATIGGNPLWRREAWYSNLSVVAMY